MFLTHSQQLEIQIQLYSPNIRFHFLNTSRNLILLKTESDLEILTWPILPSKQKLKSIAHWKIYFLKALQSTSSVGKINFWFFRRRHSSKLTTKKFIPFR